MNKSVENRLRVLAVGALLTSLLTACPQPYVPPPPGISLTFSYPAPTDASPASNGDLTLAAIAFKGSGDLTVVGRSNLFIPAKTAALQASNPVTSLYIDGYSLQNLLSPAGGSCRTFQDSEAKNLQQVTISPSDVKTCYVYFVAYRDADRDGLPNTSEEVYMTHDVLSNASVDFTYSALSLDGKSSESGSVKSGWTLLRHSVLQPEATPGRYKVSMTSVPAADQGIAIALHEPSAYLTSLSLPKSSLPSAEVTK